MFTPFQTLQGRDTLDVAISSVVTWYAPRDVSEVIRRVHCLVWKHRDGCKEPPRRLGFSLSSGAWLSFFDLSRGDPVPAFANHLNNLRFRNHQVFFNECAAILFLKANNLLFGQTQMSLEPGPFLCYCCCVPRPLGRQSFGRGAAPSCWPDSKSTALGKTANIRCQPRVFRATP